MSGIMWPAPSINVCCACGTCRRRTSQIAWSTADVCDPSTTWTGAVRPEREDLLPLTSTAHPAVEEHHGRPGAMLDNLDAAPQRRPECRGHRHSADRVPAALGGRFDEAGETVGMRTQRHGGETVSPARGS